MMDLQNPKGLVVETKTEDSSNPEGIPCYFRLGFVFHSVPDQDIYCEERVLKQLKHLNDAGNLLNSRYARDIAA